MTPVDVRERLNEKPWLIVPVGTTEQHGPHLPLGVDTIIVERLADDLSARFGVIRAPAVEYGVNTADELSTTGAATLRRKTLHGVMNELIDSWETGAGVREFVILTAQGGDAHQEALSTIRVEEANIHFVDIFAVNFTRLLERPVGPIHGGELDTSLLLYIAPDLVRMDLALDFEPSERAAAKFMKRARLPAGSEGSLGFPTTASAEKGETLYRFILDRIADRCFDLGLCEPDGES